MLKRIGVLAGMLLLLGACGDSGGGGGGVSGAVNDYNDSNKKSVEAGCECIGESQGYSSTEDCVAAEFTEQELTDCQMEAARCDATTFRAILNCEADAADDFAACLSSCTEATGGDAGQSDPDAMYEACHGDYLDALDSCGTNHSSQILNEAFGECNADAASPSCSNTSSGNNTSNNSTSNNSTPNNISGSVDQAINEYMRSFESYINAVCACNWADYGYDNEQACRDDALADNTELNSCEQAVAENNSSEFVNYAACLTAAVDDMTSCQSSCPAEAEAETCRDNATAAMNSCDDQHPQLAESMDACSE